MTLPLGSSSPTRISQQANPSTIELWPIWMNLEMAAPSPARSDALACLAMNLRCRASQRSRMCPIMPIASITCAFLSIVEALRCASIASVWASASGGRVLRSVT